MRDEQALATRPGAPTEPLTLVSELDGSTVTVGTQPGTNDAAQVVVLRLQSALLDALNAAYLLPVEARRLADALSSTAAVAAAGPTPAAGISSTGSADGAPAFGGAPSAGEHEIDDEAMMHTVTASEGASAAELRDALGTVPPAAELVDFGADADVVLVFATPARGTP